jgi:eukaryotic-like serine/threonine-protein kinase
MGEVFYAKSEGVEGFERELAIKRILPHLSSDRSFVDMLVKEAKITVLLNHPNIVQIYDLAKEVDEYYIVMEYVPGIPVSSLIMHCISTRTRLPVAVAVHIAGQTLKGLAYAHALKGPRGEAMQILHRDVTPQNLLLTRRGWVKITDFGIAKACNEISSTRPGTIKGKFGYIAPEVLVGQPLDQRVDIFSVGVLLWEMLAGQRLFKGDNDFDTARLVLECVARPITSVREDVSPSIKSCIATALERNEDKRHQDADSFYDALMRAIRPLTADDCARATEAFLAPCEALFAEKLAHGAPKHSSQSKPGEDAVRPSYSAPREAETRRTGSVSRHTPRRRFVGWVGGAAALLVALAGVAGFGMWTARERAKDAEARLALAASLATPAPPPPTPTPTPPPPASTTEPDPGHSTPAAAASPGVAPSTAPKRPPKALAVSEIQATVQRYYEPMSRCLRKLDPASTPGTIAAKLSIGANGRVGEVRTEPALAAAPARCLETALKAIRFRPGPSGFQITIPLNIEHVAP